MELFQLMVKSSTYQVLNSSYRFGNFPFEGQRSYWWPFQRSYWWPLRPGGEPSRPLGWGVDLGPPRVQHSVDLVLACREPWEMLIHLNKIDGSWLNKSISSITPHVPPPYFWCAWPRPWRPASRGRRPACTRSPRRRRRRRTGTPGPCSPLRTGKHSILRTF